MSNQTKFYRIEFKGVMSGVWMFFLQFNDLLTAKKVRKTILQTNPAMQLRIREIDLLDAALFKLFEEDV